MTSLPIPGPQMGLNEIVDAFTHQLIEEQNNNKRWNPLRPSSAGKCERELGYEYMEFKGHAKYPTESKPPAVHRLLNLGSNIEYHANQEMYKAFAKSPTPIRIKYKQQSVSICRLHDGTLIEGSIDLWIETENWRCMADWKSKSDKYSQFYKSSWDEFVSKQVATGFAVKIGEDAVHITDLEQYLKTSSDPFFNNNLYQLNMYASTEFAKERNITFCSIMQYNKNDSRIREIRFVPTESVAAKSREKFQKVALTIDTEKSVESLTKEYTLGSMKCGFCSFRKECWPEDDALKTYFKEGLPPKQWAKDLDRLPGADQTSLRELFTEFQRLNNEYANVDKVELEIIKILDKNKVYKVRLLKDQVYRIKRLKSGGPGGGARMVLRRDKE